MKTVTPLILNGLVYFIAGYVALCAIVFLLQRKLIYLPDGYVAPDDRVAAVGLRHWPSREGFRGYVDSSSALGLDDTQVDSARGTLIIFHGNAGTAFDRAHYAAALSQYDMRVILAEYPGYGGRTGSPSEATLVNDGVETVRLAFEQFGEPILLWGESIGAAVVAGTVAASDVPVLGVVLFTPWDSLTALSQTHYWYLPTALLLKDRYDSIDYLNAYTGNVVVVLAGQDRVVPIQHGQRLFESINARKKLLQFDDYGHNSVPMAPELSWWSEVIEFLLRAPRRRSEG